MPHLWWISKSLQEFATSSQPFSRGAAAPGPQVAQADHGHSTFKGDWVRLKLVMKPVLRTIERRTTSNVFTWQGRGLDRTAKLADELGPRPSVNWLMCFVKSG